MVNSMRSVLLVLASIPVFGKGLLVAHELIPGPGHR